jgi:hypothetical protein
MFTKQHNKQTKTTSSSLAVLALLGVSAATFALLTGSSQTPISDQGFLANLEGEPESYDLYKDTVYTDLSPMSDGCSKWFADVANDISRIQNDIVKRDLDQIETIKDVLIAEDPALFSTMKMQIIDDLDAARSVYTQVADTQKALSQNVARLNDEITEKRYWFYQFVQGAITA